MNIQTIYRPILLHFRRSRIRRFYREHRITSETRLLDLGGNNYFWDLARSLNLEQPRVTIVNLKAPPAHVVADARYLPFETHSFDVVFCNSVIEHVGGFGDQTAVAAEIARVGRSYWVQTPDQRFPVEPHYLGLFVHWLPIPLRRLYGRWFTLRGWLNPEIVRRLPDEIRLLGLREMRVLFPDAKMLVERSCGWPKSLIATRVYGVPR